MKTYHVDRAIPNNIEKTFRGVRKSILEVFSRVKLVGEPIGLLLVILPESRDFDGMKVYLGSDSPLVFLVCLVTVSAVFCSKN